MPIKFRCQKCRQFLGISRNQAGEIVDCPTCGRSTRVPNLDGTVDPLPGKPKLDAADSSLLNALDQLAELNQKEGAAVKKAAAAPAAEPAAVSSLDSGESVVPIALEPLAPAKAVDPPQRPKQQPKASFIAPDSRSKSDVLEGLAAGATSTAVPATERTASRIRLPVVAVTGVVLLAAGWAIGRATAPQPSPEPEQKLAEPTPKVASEPINGIVGRVTYRKSESDCVPDRGSRIIAWPVGLNADPPLKMDGFRAGDPEQLVRSAAEKLARAGGGLGIAGDDGVFQLPLASGGDYEVLFLSRFSGRQIDEEGITPAQVARLKGCFAEPQRLLGRTQFRLMRMKFRGDGQHLLDHVFEVAD